MSLRMSFIVTSTRGTYFEACYHQLLLACLEYLCFDKIVILMDTWKGMKRIHIIEVVFLVPLPDYSNFTQ